MMTPFMTKPELLAPVGSEDALLAAVRCGADAVYLGAGRFHARQHAAAFDDETLARLVAYCHARGVAVHMTLNTLVFEDEFDAALADAKRAADLGIDALIVQDRGLARAIKRSAPAMVLHASTQLSCHTPEGVKQLRDEGFSRVVLAREMSREEIAACCGLGCEIETFVHGALCMSVSGQCLISAFLGGRSGNRGTCAQPCRLPFSLNGKPRDTDRALSLKDLSLCDRAAQLGALGVASLKIEGRMKRPEYVAAAVTACRRAIDGLPRDEQLMRDLQDVFSRNGFTDGYYTARRTIDMFGSRTKEDVTAAPKAQKRLAQLYLKERAAVPLDLTLTMRRDTPLSLTASDADGHTVRAVGEMTRDNPSPVDTARLEAALSKCGGTPFYVKTVTVDRDTQADAPLSAVNALRREVTEQLLALRARRDAIPFEAAKEAPCNATRPARAAIVVRLSSAAQFSPSLAAHCRLVTLPLDTAPEALRRIAAQCDTAVEIPRGLFSKEETAYRALCTAKECGVKAAVCHNVGALPLARRAGLPAVGGWALYTANLETCFAHRDAGLVAATASVELTSRQAAFATQSPIPVGAFVYGRVPLMLLRNCPQKAQKGCAACGQHSTLTDRKGVSFPLTCTYGCSEVLNSVPLYIADKLRPDAFAFHTLYMTDETPDDVLRITRAVAADVPFSAEAVCRNGFTRKGW